MGPDLRPVGCFGSVGCWRVHEHPVADHDDQPGGHTVRHPVPDGLAEPGDSCRQPVGHALAHQRHGRHGPGRRCRHGSLQLRGPFPPGGPQSILRMGSGRLRLAHDRPAMVDESRSCIRTPSKCCRWRIGGPSVSRRCRTRGPAGRHRANDIKKQSHIDRRPADRVGAVLPEPVCEAGASRMNSLPRTRNPARRSATSQVGAGGGADRRSLTPIK